MMTNPLTTARDAFLADNPEQRLEVNSRTWGTIRTGDSGPALVLIPGTLGRADIFWQQIAALVVGSLVGSRLGSWISHRLPATSLRYGLAVLIGASAIGMWFQLVA